MATSDTPIAISVVVPIFNEEGNIAELHRRLTTTLTSINKPYELIFIDDGSKDASLKHLRTLQKQDPQVVVIKLARNFGQHPAIVAGLHRAQGAAVVLIDADLQNPPEEIIPLYEKFLEGFEVVYGARQGREDAGWRKLGSRFVVHLTEKMLGIHVPNDMISGFRIIHRKVVNALNSIKEQQYDTSIMMLWLGFSHAAVPVRHDPRQSGESKYSLGQLLYLTLDMLIGFSDLPLRAASLTGALLAILSFILGIYRIIQRLAGYIDVEGYTSLFVGLTFLAGIQLLFLGIIGEYIARIYREIKGRPYYVISEIYQQDDPKEG